MTDNLSTHLEELAKRRGVMITSAYRPALATKVINELRAHPAERRLSGPLGFITLNAAACSLIEELDRLPERTPQQQEHLNDLLAVMMADYSGNPAFLTTKQKQDRKKWAAMEKQAGHILGLCFDMEGGLCPVCRA